MKNTYAILREDGAFYRAPYGASTDCFYSDVATLFNEQDHAHRVWETLPYHLAVRSKIVKLTTTPDHGTSKT